MTRFVIVAVFSLALSATARADGNCSPDAVRSSAAKAAEIRKSLLEIKVADDGQAPDLPASTQAAIRAFKNALTATLDAYFACEQRSTAPAKEIENQLAQPLSANIPSVKPDSSPTGGDDREIGEIFGSDLQIAVRREERDPPLMGVQIGLGLPCGSDNLLLIYEWTSNAWRRAIRWQSDDYASVLDAFGEHFQYVIISGKSHGEWLVAVAHGSPWCTSNWSRYDLDVLSAGNGVVGQHPVFHKEFNYRRDLDPELRGEPDGFTLRLHVENLDPTHNERAGIYHYRLNLGQVRRYQPVAENARDFLDEWLQSNWNEAIDWTARKDMRVLEREHEIIADMIDEHKYLSYGPVRSCRGKGDLVQIELQGAPSGFRFFQIEKEKDSFTVVTSTNTSDPKCAGSASER